VENKKSARNFHWEKQDEPSFIADRAFRSYCRLVRA
jgi:hypothetical protein